MRLHSRCDVLGYSTNNCQTKGHRVSKVLSSPPSFSISLFNLSLPKLSWIKHNRMAIKMLMDITMAYALFLLLLLIPETVARYLSGGAVETQPGLTATNGISPVPTEAPGLNGIPKELRKRAIQSFIYPPPPNWCGMVDGDYREFLSSNYFFYLIIILSLSNLAIFKENILSCPPNTPCLLKSSFYGACGCTSLNTDLCFDVSPTICVDYDVYETVISLGSLTVPW